MISFVLLILCLFRQEVNSFSFLLRRMQYRSEYAHSPGAIDPEPIAWTRRTRYSGKYPKNYNEKYKEHSRNATVVAKVIEKGGTPAGSHIPILLNEIVDLVPNASSSSKNNKTVVSMDCTLGYGGHTKSILNKLFKQQNTQFRHFMIDQDCIEMTKTKDRIEETFGAKNMACLSFHHLNFKDIESLISKECLHGQVDFLLADLGFSSMQIDDPARGFTYKVNAPLDMRMDVTSSGKTETAYEYLSRVRCKELEAVLKENSDECLALPLARALVTEPIPSTTTALADRVRACYKAHHLSSQQQRTGSTSSKEDLNKAVARTMQAIRIEINGEFQALDNLLSSLPGLLSPNGIAVFLTFHSGEDRRVKKAFKSGFKNGIYSEWSREVTRAGAEERRSNPRSKCAKLRFAIRSGLPPDGLQLET